MRLGSKKIHKKISGRKAPLGLSDEIIIDVNILEKFQRRFAWCSPPVFYSKFLRECKKVLIFKKLSGGEHFLNPRGPLALIDNEIHPSPILKLKDGWEKKERSSNAFLS